MPFKKKSSKIKKKNYEAITSVWVTGERVSYPRLVEWNQLCSYTTHVRREIDGSTLSGTQVHGKYWTMANKGELSVRWDTTRYHSMPRVLQTPDVQRLIANPHVLVYKNVLLWVPTMRESGEREREKGVGSQTSTSILGPSHSMGPHA